jgi:HK97 family phage prohead protease
MSTMTLSDHRRPAPAADAERRVLSHGADLRAAGPMRLAGYAALFNTPTTIAGLFREQIAPGAFRAALDRGDDVRALFNHDAGVVLGRTRSGTLRLTEDHRGLRYELDLPDTTQARDVWTLVQRGDISQSSFAFTVPDGGDDITPAVSRSDLPLRIINTLQLFDVSPVTYPAYAETTVSARAQQRLGRVGGVSGDWRQQLATRKAHAATVAACRPLSERVMPRAFLRDPRSRAAWAAHEALAHRARVMARATSQHARRAGAR